MQEDDAYGNTRKHVESILGMEMLCGRFVEIFLIVGVIIKI